MSKAMAPMSLGGDRNAKNKPIGADGKREWSNGLMNCFADSSACKLSSFIPYTLQVLSPSIRN